MEHPRSPIDPLPISTLYRRPRTPLTLSFASASLPEDSPAPAPSSSGYLSPRAQLPKSPKEGRSVITFDFPPVGARRRASWRGDDPRAGGGSWAKRLRRARDALEVGASVLSLGGVISNGLLLDSSRRYCRSSYQERAERRADLLNLTCRWIVSSDPVDLSRRERKMYSNVIVCSWMGFNVELLCASTLALVSLPALCLGIQPRFPTHPLSSLATELAVLLILWTLSFAGALTLNMTLPGLHFCAGFALCDQARVVQVFAWSSVGVLAAAVGVVAVEGWRSGEWGRRSGEEGHRGR